MGIRLLFALCITFLLTGCYDLREPEETGIVSGIGIDRREDGKIVLIAERQNQKITFEIFGSTAALKPEVVDGQPVIKVKISANGNLGEVNPGIYEIDDRQITLMEKLLAQTIQLQVLAAVNKAKELNTDVLGFGEAVHRAFPEQWNKGLSKEWPEMFQDIAVKVEPTVRIKGLGQISASVKTK
ncbi:MAG: Ger(x)C family spore germination C-terminal domain-containing protein [Bacillota bacterium]|nr:Ger(x)C family spore germination C-terminal domain-containing protein [Bacillota bacterium]